jgi:hypothetical protein
MKMYRAVPKASFGPNAQFEGLTTRRTPSNVPFLVDNLWEWLRPEHAPSRRHAMYASPTPELALANASAVGSDPSKYVVCELETSGPGLVLAHLLVKDARDHHDIGALVRLVSGSMGREFGSLPLAEKTAHAALYVPAVSKEELSVYFESTEAAKQLAKEVRAVSTFWQDASYTPQDHNGEFFFEIPAGVICTLRPL